MNAHLLLIKDQRKEGRGLPSEAPLPLSPKLFVNPAPLPQLLSCVNDHPLKTCRKC